MAPNYQIFGFGGLSGLGRPQNSMFFLCAVMLFLVGGGSGQMSSVFLRMFGSVLVCSVMCLLSVCYLSVMFCYVSVMCLLCVRYVLLCVGLFQELRSH